MIFGNCNSEQVSSNVSEAVQIQNIEKKVDNKVATSENIILIPGAKKNVFLTSEFVEGGQTIQFSKKSETSPIELIFKLGSPNGIDLFVTYKNNEDLSVVNLMNLENVKIEYDEPSDNDDYGQASIYDVDADGSEDVIAAFSNGKNSFVYNVFMHDGGKKWVVVALTRNSLMSLEDIITYVSEI